MNISGKLERIEQLTSQGRFAEARQFCETVLEEYPDLPFLQLTYARVLFNNEEYDKCRRITEGLLNDDPEDANALLLSIHLDLHDKNVEKAESKAEILIEQVPDSAVAYYLMARVKMEKNSYDKALEAINIALQIDPEDVDAINYKIQIDRLIGNNNKVSIDNALHLDPENPSSIANHGIQLLHQGDVKGALERLSEALTLDPNNAIAQHGMREAMKSKFWLYRMFYKVGILAARLSGKNLWVIIIGAYIGLRVLKGVAKSNEALQPFLNPIIFVVVGLFYLTWILDPLMNLYLMMNKFGRHLLSKKEKTSATLVGGTLTAAVICLLVFLLTKTDNILMLGIVFFVSIIPFSSFLDPVNESTRKKLVIGMSSLFVIGLIGAVIGSLPLSFIYFGSIFIYQFLINGILIKENARVFE